jgi:hypothetical protein
MFDRFLDFSGLRSAPHAADADQNKVQIVEMNSAVHNE